MRHRPLPRLCLILSCLAALAAGACADRPTPTAAPSSADSILLTYASPYPAAHPFSQADQAWMDHVTQASGGRVRFMPFWSGVLLSSDMSMTEIRHGVADIGLITPIYSRGGAHLLRAQSGFYGGVRSIEEQVRVYDCLAERFPEFGRELDGLVVLAVQGGNFPGVVTRERPIRHLSDFRGLRLRAQSDAVDVLRALGADPVNMPMAEVYSAMAKGVIDGVVAPADTIRSLHFSEVGRYFTAIHFPRGAYPARAISTERFNQLPPDIQAVLLQSRPFWEAELSRNLLIAEEAGADFGREDGMTFSRLPPAEQARFDALYQSFSNDQARALQRFGIDGPPILAAAQAAIRDRVCPTETEFMSDLPLTDVKIADFSWVGAGPRATKDLADYGAEVIKIESRKRLDLGRLSPPFAGGRKDPDGSAFFAITNTSKKGVTLNLGDPRAIEIAKKLVAWADVVVENFSKGYMERIGLGYDTLRAIKPDIIMISVSVAGRAGPAGDLRGYGNVAAAMSGLAALSGWTDRGPHMPPFAYGDVIAPMFATVATLAALEHHRRTGEGQHVDISQLEPLVHVLADEFARAQSEPGFAKLANSSPDMAPRGVWPGRDGRWIAIAVDDDDAWTSLAALAGIDPALGATVEDRRSHGAEIDALLTKWTAGRDVHELADRLAAAGIAAEAVQNGRDLCEDAELRGSGHFHRIHHEKLGACDMPGPPLRFSDAAIRVEAPPMLGEHNDEIFGDLLGLAPDEIARLTADGVLG